MMDPITYVIIVNWNGKRHLGPCLDSLKAQEGSSHRVIVVDNGSSDGSVQFLRERYPEAEVISLGANRMFASAANIGMRRALDGGAEFVALLNNDTVVSKDWLASLIKTAVEDKRIGICASKMLRMHDKSIIDSTGHIFKDGIIYDRGSGEEESGQYDAKTDVVGGCGGAVLYRKQMLDEIGLFDGSFGFYYEDAELSWRAYKSGWKAKFVPGAVVYHERGATARQDEALLRHGVVNMVRTVNRHASIAGKIRLSIIWIKEALRAALRRIPREAAFDGAYLTKLRLLWFSGKGRDRKIRILVFGMWDKDDASSALRVTGPLGLLPRYEFDITYTATIKALFRLFLVPHIIIVPRSPISRMADSGIKRFAEAMKIPVVADVDDLITDVPALHMKHSEYSNIKDGITGHWRDADILTVTNRQLKEALKKYNENIHIFPNLIDIDIWGLSKESARKTRGNIVIGYAGSVSHGYEFKTVLPAIKEILAKYRGKVVFRSIGCAPAAGEEIAGLEHIKQVGSYKEYAGILAGSGFDIVLAPLEENLFNRCKSDIKFLEYSICGYPGIYSNVGPYKESVKDGVTGILTGNTTNEWVAAMERMIEDFELRETLAKNALKYVEENRMLYSSARERIEFYRDLASAEGVLIKRGISLRGVMAYGVYSAYDLICKWMYIAGRMTR